MKTGYEIGVVYKDGALIPCNSVMSYDMQENMQDGHYYSFKLVKHSDSQKRTLLQNKCIHLFLTQLSRALNDAGLDMRRVLKPEIDIPWSLDTAKEFLWRNTQKIMFNKESTAELETSEVSDVYEVINRHIAGKHGIHVPWPDRFSQSMEQENDGI